MRVLVSWDLAFRRQVGAAFVMNSQATAPIGNNLMRSILYTIIVCLTTLPAVSHGQIAPRKDALDESIKMALAMHVAVAMNERAAVLSSAEDLALRMILKELDRSIKQQVPDYYMQVHAIQKKMATTEPASLTERDIAGARQIAEYGLARFIQTYKLGMVTAKHKPRKGWFDRAPEDKDNAALNRFTNAYWNTMKAEDPERYKTTRTEMMSYARNMKNEGPEVAMKLKQWQGVVLSYLTDQKRAAEGLPYVSADPDSLHWYGVRPRGNVTSDWLAVVHDSDDVNSDPIDFKIGIKRDGRFVFNAAETKFQKWRKQVTDQDAKIQIKASFHFARLPEEFFDPTWRPEEWAFQKPAKEFNATPDFVVEGEKGLGDQGCEVVLPDAMKDKLTQWAENHQGILVVKLSVKAVKGDKELATWGGSKVKPHGYWLPCWSFPRALAWAQSPVSVFK